LALVLEQLPSLRCYADFNRLLLRCCSSATQKLCSKLLSDGSRWRWLLWPEFVPKCPILSSLYFRRCDLASWFRTPLFSLSDLRFSLSGHVETEAADISLESYVCRGIKLKVIFSSIFSVSCLPHPLPSLLVTNGLLSYGHRHRTSNSYWYGSSRRLRRDPLQHVHRRASPRSHSRQEIQKWLHHQPGVPLSQPHHR
jgi:hypothetical protein